MDVRVGAPTVTATPTRVLEPRRWAAFHCFGIMDLLLMVHASHEDVVGAVGSGQLAVARFATREVVLRTSAVRSLWTEGFPADPTDALADPFAGLDPHEIQVGLDLVHRMVRAVDAAEATAHLPAIDAYVRRLESDLGYSDRAPSVRRPEGTFPALRMVRQIMPINWAAHLPSAMPTAWLPYEGDAAAPKSSDGAA